MKYTKNPKVDHKRVITIKEGRKFLRLNMILCLCMDFVVITLIIVLIFLVGMLILKSQRSSPELLEYLKTTNTRIDSQNSAIGDRLDNASRVVSDLQKNIAEFNQFLASPKLRGNIGEQVLKELLKQFLPNESFNLQYTFKSGEKVDAAIMTSAGIIPVDSKFPLENFRKMQTDPVYKKVFESDVRKHIDDISRKYILTDEGTLDYALMYIPSEAVYYEIVNNQTLFDFAQSKRILPVSPTTFYAYIKAILMSFEGQKIEKQAQVILSSLRAIKKDYGKVEENLSTLQKHLVNATKMMTNVFTSFTNLGNKIDSTKSLEE